MGRLTSCFYKLGIKYEVDYYLSFIKDCVDTSGFDYTICDPRPMQTRGPTRNIKAVYCVRGKSGTRGKPIEFDRKIDDDNGNLFLENFVEGFIGGGERGLLYNIVDSPVFSVIDLNSAHHFSYILAKKALSLYPDKYRLIVNVDQHIDFDGKDVFTGLAATTQAWKQEYENKTVKTKGPPRVISCGNWGKRAINYGCEKTNKSFSITPAADAYLAIGCGENLKTTGTTVLRQSMSDGEQFKTTQHERMYAGSLLVMMDNVGYALKSENSTFDWANTAVYFTLDRDVMIFNGTKYRDGAYSPKIVHNRLTRLFDFFKQKKVVVAGVDTIGLPEITGSSSAYRQLIDEIMVQAYTPSAEAKSWSIWIKQLKKKPEYRTIETLAKKHFPGMVSNEKGLKEIVLIWFQAKENIRTLYNLYKTAVNGYRIDKSRGLTRFIV